MEIGLLFVWGGMGVAFLNQSNTSKLEWSIERKERRLGMLHLLFVLEKREIEGVLKVLSYLIKSLNPHLCVTF